MIYWSVKRREKMIIECLKNKKNERKGDIKIHRFKTYSGRR